MAGALDSRLRLGDWVIGDRVCGASGALCDGAWNAALKNALPAALVGTVFADGSLAVETGRKTDLAARFGAIAVDMESHLAAELAATHNLPFAILRCISDEASADMPPAIVVAMGAQGRLDFAAIMRSLLSEPGQIPALIGTTRRFRRAYAALCQGAASIGPELGFDRR